AVALGIFGLYKADFLTGLLTPFDKPAFEVRFGLLQRLDIHVGFDDMADQKVFGKYIALIQVDGTDQRFEGVAQEGALLIGVADHAGVILDKFVESEFS